jgi:hypothetical protein
VIAAGSTSRRWILIAALAAVLGGCGNTYQQKWVPYVAPKPPGPDETLFYVFRSLGDFRKLAIIDNDTIVAVLDADTFSTFTVPSGVHEIVGYYSGGPIMHYRVPPAPGKTVYLFCWMAPTSGRFMEAMDEARAKLLGGRFKYTEIEVKGAKADRDYKVFYDQLYK